MQESGPAVWGNGDQRTAARFGGYGANRTEGGGLLIEQLWLSRATGIDGSHVVSVAGELDIATAGQAFDYLADVIDHGQAPVSVDLSGLTFCDASGLSVFAKAARRARDTHRAFMLTSIRPSLLRIMRLTGLDAVFPELCSPARLPA